MPIWPLCVSTPSGGREPRPRGRLAAPYGSRGAPAHLASRLGKAARSRSHPCLVGLATTTPAARQTITLDPQNENSSTPAVVLDHRRPSLAHVGRNRNSAMNDSDYIVIGGGSSGCVVAARLSEDPNVTVTLLEAGGVGDSWIVRTPLTSVLMVPSRLNNWAFKTEPQAGLGGRCGYQPRGRVLGGSSAINAMIY